ncbi:hypothetical protein O163_14180 [Caldanaerobacter subterraneus subsp. yonseiensis KB-1]|uniref:Uncharacterized protein n=1 Tax=Caldanaerobacter subterraneus subsp. yonseiensis KB-1 TaxID=1388761 RepID=U5CCV7_CALSX|nr:hypothetical protein O163_14180 [Caldanaerobacter subterraneus subsp. yonseiensis KB-1]
MERKFYLIIILALSLLCLLLGIMLFITAFYPKI